MECSTTLRNTVFVIAGLNEKRSRNYDHQVSSIDWLTFRFSRKTFWPLKREEITLRPSSKASSQ